ncbi:MAG TPA: hypothetical protein V6C90_08685 [Coleofasciculaceae cyanobacterium]|jgi:molybdopterin-guanine dinucleotide biosynthesis protein A
MNPSTLRQFWSLVDATQAATLMALDDTKLVEQLIEQLKKQCSLNSSQTDMISAYIRSRIPLVRDLAQTRQLGYA